MQKKLPLIITGAVIALIAILLCVATASPNTIVSGGSFHLEEEILFEENLPENRQLGAVPDEQSAVLAANQLWKEVYGREFRGKISVAYDEKNACFKVCGELSLASLFDFPYFPNAIIKTDGTVLSIWLGQF